MRTKEAFVTHGKSKWCELNALNNGVKIGCFSHFDAVLHNSKTWVKFTCNFSDNEYCIAQWKTCQKKIKTLKNYKIMRIILIHCYTVITFYIS